MLTKPTDYVETEAIVIKPKKSSWWWRWTLYIIYPILGLVGLILALLLSITIIGLFIALPLFAGSFAALAYPFTYKINHLKIQKIDCPRCDHTKRIMAKTPAFNCNKCKIRVGINWIE